MTFLKRGEIYFFSFLLAFCSLYYEYVYAQILSVCLGGTKTQYLLTISLFTCALGLGSLSFEKLKGKYQVRKIFLTVEIGLSILGGLGPFLITAILTPNAAGNMIMGTIFSYSFIFAIGLLSGLEIPSLFSLLQNKHGKILFYDYLGMLGASSIFPFVLLPILGTAGGSLFVASLNLFAVTWLIQGSKPVKACLYSFNVIALYLTISFSESFNNILSSLYLGGL